MLILMNIIIFINMKELNYNIYPERTALYAHILARQKKKLREFYLLSEFEKFIDTCVNSIIEANELHLKHQFNDEKINIDNIELSKYVGTDIISAYTVIKDNDRSYLDCIDKNIKKNFFTSVHCFADNIIISDRLSTLISCNMYIYLVIPLFLDKYIFFDFDNIKIYETEKNTLIQKLVNTNNQYLYSTIMFV